MKHERLRTWAALILTLTCFSIGANTSAAPAAAAAGKLSGVVRDSAGTPQMGATVEIVPEAAIKAASLGLLTNTRGIFHGESIAPGLYTLRITLAGFLPTIQQHVRISAHVTTVVRVELESMFASLDQLRRQPSTANVETDDWKWVLRSASITRPVLQWADDGATTATYASYDAKTVRPRARLDFTDGARRPGSASNLPSAPATAFAYDQDLGGVSRLLLAGQVNYEGEVAGGGIAAVWLPTGSGRTNVPRRSPRAGWRPAAGRPRAATLRRRIRVGWHGKVRHVSSSAPGIGYARHRCLAYCLDLCRRAGRGHSSRVR